MPHEDAVVYSASPTAARLQNPARGEKLLCAQCQRTLNDPEVKVLNDGGWVTNAAGSSVQKAPRPSKSWKDYWMRHAEQAEFGQCCNQACDKEAAVGGHVLLEGTYTKIYIVPACQACNKQLFTFKVRMA